MKYDVTVTVDLPEVECESLALAQAELIARTREAFPQAPVVEVSFFDDGGELVAVS